MSNTQDFAPNWASMPGESIADILHERKLSLEDFAIKMESTEQDVLDLIHGFITINDRIAKQLQKVLGGSSEYWIRREELYRNSVERLRSTEEKRWLQDLPLGDMLRFNWISKTNDVVTECLHYFNVPDVWTWRKKYRDINTFASFRRSPVFKSVPAAVAAWIRQAEIQAQDINANEWDPIKFRELLPSMKNLSRVKDPTSFLPKLKDICAQCGVALVMAPTPEGCATSGAAKFLSPKKALIAQSFRYGTDDHFWFTFFHEAGHLLLHGNKDVFIDEKNFSEMADQSEQEANNFSVSCLIPVEIQLRLRTMPISQRSIKDAANASGVSLGIIVGQLQHLKRVPYNHFGGFKRRYEWPAYN